MAEKRIMQIATRVGPKTVMGFLLGVLRRNDIAEQVVDVVAKTMALCSGPCAAPPELRTFIFSPNLTIHAPDKFPRLARDEKFDWIVGSDLLYEQACSLALAKVIRRRLSTIDSKALLVTPVREKETLKQFLKDVDQLG
ncbi:hypothetical protein KI387_034763, partial [Taxus chinensis]